MKVFAYVYCPCIYESAEGVVSLHFTEEGAQKAMEAAKQERYEDWVEDQQWRRDNPQFEIEPEVEYKESDFTYHKVREWEVVK